MKTIRITEVYKISSDAMSPFALRSGTLKQTFNPLHLLFAGKKYLGNDTIVLMNTLLHILKSAIFDPYGVCPLKSKLHGAVTRDH